MTGQASYFFKGIPAALWKQVKVRAAKRGETIRAALLRFLERYAKGQE